MEGNNKYSVEEIIKIIKDKGFKNSELKVADEKISESFACPICLKLVWDPIFCINCAKPVCFDCIKQYYQKNKIRGNPCVFKCGGNGYRKMTNKEKEFIDLIKLKCKHQGCNQFINYSDYKEHLSKCKFRLCRCNNKSCNFEGCSYQMDIHIKQCEWREIECSKCKNKIVFNSKENHINNDCPETIISCIFCNQKMKRIDYIKNHKSTDASCLKNLMEKLTKKINDDEKNLKEKEDKIDELKKKLKEYRKRLQEKETDFQSLSKKTEIFRKKNEENAKYIEQFRMFILDGYNRFKANDISKEKELDMNININKEIQKKDNLYLNTESNFYPKKNIQIRTRNTIFNNEGNLTERNSARGMRRTFSEANFNNVFNKK